MMKERARVILFGAGVIGCKVVKHLLEKPWAELVGVVDIDPAKVGKDVAEVAGIEEKVGVVISKDLDEVLSRAKADVVVHTTSSFFRKVYPELEQIVGRGLDVVSSCEELSFPYFADEKLAHKLDLWAKKHGSTVLGTGINPGFLMDALPLTLTAPCLQVNSIRVVRKMNAGTRRVPFQKKVGAGMTPESFKEAISSGKISGHVGLEESISMIAAGLGWKLDELRVGEVQPVILQKEVKSDWVEIPPGKVAGLRQTAEGLKDGKAMIRHEFVAYVGAEEEYDLVEIDGLPKVTSRITPCVHGDYGTVAMLINMVPKVLEAPPGLYTMKDLPIPSAVVPRP